MHSDDGLDELTVTAPVTVARVRDGGVSMERVDAADLGFARASVADLQARDLDHAAQIIRDVLAGERGAPRDMVELSAAATLQVADCVSTLEDGVVLAREAIDSGRARTTLGLLAERSHGR
jgi:anthranilate phosphoribosyltransferase